MSIESLLTELISSVEGATGAIIVDAEGEGVVWRSRDGERLRLRGAYVKLLLRRRTSYARAGPGEIRCLALEYDSASLIAQQVDDECLVVLEMSPFANLSEAMFHLERVARELRRELSL